MNDRPPRQAPRAPVDALRSRAFRIAGLYGLLAGLWIFVSDWLLGLLAGNSPWLVQVAALKGWLFIAATALGLYLLLRRAPAPPAQPTADAPADPVAGAEAEASRVPVPGGGWRRLALPAALLSVAALTAITAALDYRAGMHRQTRQLELMAESRARQAGRWLQAQLQQAQRGAEAGPGAEPYRAWQAADDAASLARLLAAAVQLRQALGHQEALLLDARGELLASERPQPPLPEQLRQSALQALQGGRAGHTGLYLARGEGGGTWLDLLVPLPAQPPRPQALLVLRADPGGFLLPMLAVAPLPASPSAATVLVRRLGHQLYGLPGEPPVPLSQPDRLVARVSRGDLPAGLVATGTDATGRRVLGVVQPVDDDGWFLVARVAQAEARATALRNTLWIVAAGALALLALVTGARLRRDRRALHSARRQQAQQAEQLRGLALMQAIAEGSSDAIFAKDLQGRYVLCNREACRVIGLPLEAVLGQDDRALFPPAQAEAVMANDAQVLAEGRLNTYEERIDIGQGRLTFLATKGPLRDEAGNVVGVFGISRDITERSRAVEALRDATDLLQSVKDSVLDRMAVLDREGRVLEVNAAWRAFAERAATQPGLHVATAGPGTDYLARCRAAEGDEQPVAQAAAQGIEAVLAGRRSHFTLEYPCSLSGTRQWFQMSVTPLRSAAGGAVLLHADTTQRRLAEEALRESAARYRSMVSVLDEGILVFDRRMQVTACNAPAERFMGLTLAQMQQPGNLQRWQPLRPDGQPLPFEELPPSRTLRTGQPCRNMLVGAAMPQGMRWLMVNAEPVRDGEGGELTGVVASFSDITERHVAEGELRKLSMAVAQSPVGIVVSDLQGRIEYVNEAFTRISGWPQEEALGQTGHRLQPGRGPAERMAELRRKLADGQAWAGEFANTRRDGEPYEEFVHAAPIRQPDGRITHHLLVVEDITHHKRIGLELDRHRHRLQELVDERTRQLQDTNALLVASRDKAEAANRAKSAFLANMSHEIRTPLNAILGLTHLMRRDARARSERERLARVSEAADHLLQVLNDILDLSKIEAGRLELEATDFSLSALLGSTCALVAQRAQSRGLLLTVDTSAAPDALRGDPTRLSQALLNLLSNAVKFTERGGIAVVVSPLPASTAAQPWLRFEVRDTGIGIAPEHLGGLFGAFVQADASTTRRFGGTGLGLAITRRLAEMMDGEVGVHSTPGQGSRFWFTARLQAGDPAATGPRWPAPRPQDAERMLQRHCTGATVLLVEDNPVNQDVIRELLLAAGLQVELAGDGAQAVARLARPPVPALVLMDVQMPVLDGLQATRQVRAQPGPAQRVPILAMTANAFGEDRAACLAAGMDDHVGKPVNPAELYATLWRWLGSGTAVPALAPPLPPPAAPRVAGLDAEQALGYMGGSLDVYQRVLRQFAEHYAVEAGRLAEAAAQGDLAGVRAVAHALRSAAAAIGATTLAADAQAAEAAAVQALAEAAAPAPAVEAGRQLAADTAALAQRIAQALGDEAAQEAGAPIAAASLDRLEALLEAADYDAQALFRSMAGGLRRWSPEGAARAEAALARFDYDEVLKLVRAARTQGLQPAPGGAP
ncbi:PAS domain-containing protein [Aquincola sp. J276]|uniref:PAS domain-containing protein n=1 Tax=Aquincola sp. J276 TaxID=2898432 RepID=UPI0021518884|nr:PAS domain-containing protein [Aquincola sp. J276]MCR5868838.1 PAS domain-containing protein [Aquincola sp. J276]